MTERALIIGVGGLDGSHLADLLLAEGVEVHGLHRHTSTGNLSRLTHLLSHPGFTLHRGDLTDVGSLYRVVSEVRPRYLFNEADQDNVGWSLALPSLASRVTYGAVADLLEVVRQVVPTCRVFQPCSSTVFGSAPAPQSEASPLDPQSPYAVAKAAAWHLCRHYRHQHGLHVSCGVLFNHTSPRQGGDYLLHKIARGVVAIKRGQQQTIALGNLDTAVDIGHAADVMRAAWLMVRQDAPDDYAIGTGVAWTIREMVRYALVRAGLPDDVDLYVTTDQAFWRPATETRADASKARRVLGWVPTLGMSGVIRELVGHYEGVK